MNRRFVTDKLFLKYMTGFRIIILHSILLLLISASLSAQGGPPDPPVPPTIENTKQLSFGAFYATVPGNVVVNYDGARSSPDGVILLTMGSYAWSAAVFSIKATPGTVVSILKDTGTTMNCTDCSGTMNLTIGESNPAGPFVITTESYDDITEMSIGGTLTVKSPAENPPGNYSGTFNVTLIQE